MGHRSTGFVCVMGFGSPIWFWFLWVLVRRDGSAGKFIGGFRSGLRFRLGLLGWWALAMVCAVGFFFFFFEFWWLGVEVVVGGGGCGCGCGFGCGRWWQWVLAVVVGLLVVKQM